jgi:hypothetical protein
MFIVWSDFERLMWYITKMKVIGVLSEQIALYSTVKFQGMYPKTHWFLMHSMVQINR